MPLLTSATAHVVIVLTQWKSLDHTEGSLDIKLPVKNTAAQLWQQQCQQGSKRHAFTGQTAQVVHQTWQLDNALQHTMPVSNLCHLYVEAEEAEGICIT